ncbi:MAG: sigma-70 family RNA polymerase sigma factor [Nitriliruptor sp.]|uniref:sigma-70 family RNA polymerase sigma factor n=1 Tax=Nitriliruptor sp. TaxID=2448056 RepID=UPI0034A083BD
MGGDAVVRGDQGAAGTEPGSFDGFYRAHVTSTLAVVIALRGHRVGAEDVVQEAFLRAHHRWQQVADMDRPDLWVQRVALNLATSQLRRLGAETRALVRLRGRPAPPVTEAFGREQGFWDAVRRLPPKQARVVALRYAADLPVVEIAEVVGVAEGTVKAQLHTARARLAVLLHDEEVGR